jgi:hypothetical protein
LAVGQEGLTAFEEELVLQGLPLAHLYVKEKENLLGNLFWGFGSKWWRWAYWEGRVNLLGFG